MIVVQFLKDRNYLQKFSEKLAPFTKVIGVQPNASMTLVAGLVIGLAYGAGVMIQAVQEDGVSKKDATLAFIFLVACHAVVEDTLIFMPLGIPVSAIADYPSRDSFRLDDHRRIFLETGGTKEREGGSGYRWLNQLQHCYLILTEHYLIRMN